MRRRFFVDEIHSGKAEILGDDARHLTRVLRVEAGQEYEISDNKNVYLAEIEMARKEHVVFRTTKKLPPPPLSVQITLCASLIKFDHFEWMVEKATELGITTLVPMVATRSEKGLDKAARGRVERWRRIALETCQQCRRAKLPVVEDALPFSKVVNREFPIRYVLDEEGGEPLLKAIPTTKSVTDHVALLTGPEGGWTDGEREVFVRAGWKRVSLGSLILRAETAALSALSVIQAGWLE
jgi:16S rRNA (uracil1498-N3)-methyltransferase